MNETHIYDETRHKYNDEALHEYQGEQSSETKNPELPINITTHKTPKQTSKMPAIERRRVINADFSQLHTTAS
jgi:hypothetical protein